MDNFTQNYAKMPFLVSILVNIGRQLTAYYKAEINGQQPVKPQILACASLYTPIC